jgi:hypothetical protein
MTTRYAATAITRSSTVSIVSASEGRWRRASSLRSMTLLHSR